MSKFITIFYPRATQGAHTDGMSGERQDDAFEIAVFSRRPLKSRLQGRNLVDEQAWHVARKELCEALQGRGQSGVVVAVLARQRGQEAWIEFVSENGAAWPDAVLIQRPGYPPQLKALPQAAVKIEVPRGSHLIVPVDQASQKHLERFLEDLQFLPADRGALLLNALGRPELEELLCRMEWALDRREGERVQSAKSSGRSRLRRLTAGAVRFFRGPVPVWLFLLAVLIAVVTVAGPLQPSTGEHARAGEEAGEVPASGDVEGVPLDSPSSPLTEGSEGTPPEAHPPHGAREPEPSPRPTKPPADDL